MSKETGLLKAWPANGPPVVWTAGGLGNGYGSMAVAGERVFVQGTRGGRSVVVALNRADGKEVWSKALGQAGNDDRGPGPRGTPTVDGDRLYVLTELGDLACLKTDGTEVWQRNILRDFSGPQIRWQISESPLVDGAHVIVSPGGPGAGMVKLDKMTGKTVWTAKELSDAAGYSSPIVADVQGVRTYMTFTAARRRRRPRLGRQADVPLPDRREPHREHHDADLLRQQGVLHVRLRHRRGPARPDARRTARSRRRRSISRAR